MDFTKIIGTVFWTGCLYRDSIITQVSLFHCFKREILESQQDNFVMLGSESNSSYQEPGNYSCSVNGSTVPRE